MKNCYCSSNKVCGRGFSTCRSWFCLNCKKNHSKKSRCITPSSSCARCGTIHPKKNKCPSDITKCRTCAKCGVNHPKGQKCRRTQRSACVKPTVCVKCGKSHSKREKCTCVACGKRHNGDERNFPPAMMLNNALGLEAHDVAIEQIDDAIIADRVNGFLAAMQAARETEICAICQMYKTKGDVMSVDLEADWLRALVYTEEAALGRKPEHVHTVTTKTGITLCLEKKAVLQDNTAIACKECVATLRAGRVPSYSLKNMDQGLDPLRIEGLELEELTFAETLLLCKNRTLAKVFRVTCKRDYLDKDADNATKARVIRGNTITLQLPDELTHRVSHLPRSISSLEDDVAIAFIGKVDSEQEAAKLVSTSWQLKVRAERTAKWAKFIIDCSQKEPAKNRAPGPVLFNEQWNAGHEDGTVPQTFVYQIKNGSVSVFNGQSNDNDMSRNESYNLDFETHVKDCIGEPAMECDEKVCDANFSSVAINEPSITHGLGVQTGSELVNQFSPTYFVDSMTHLFPAGSDGRPEGMKIEEWAKILLLRADARFESDFTFSFVLFQVLLKRKLFNSTKFRFNLADFAIFDRLTPSEKGDFGKIIANNFVVPKDLNVSVNTLQAVGKVKKTTGYMPKSKHAMHVNRKRIFYGMYPLLGPPGAFFTLNIDFPRSKLFFDFLGIAVQTNVSKRLQLLSARPASLARFFHSVLAIAMQELFGISFGYPGGGVQYKYGIAGRARSFFASIETNARKFHHAHIVLWFLETDLRVMRNMQETGVLEAKLQGYIDSVISATFNDHADYDNTGADETAEQRLKTENDLREAAGIPTVAPPRVLQAKVPNDDIGLQEAQPLPTEVPLEDCEFYQERLAALQRVYQIHTCMSSCYKNKKQRDNKECRMRAKDMELRNLTKVDIIKGIIHLARNHPALVETCSALLYSLQSNSKFEFIVNSKAKAACVFYTIKYALKSDIMTKELYSIAKMIQQKLDAIDNDEILQNDDNARRLKLLNVINMTLIGNATYSATEAAAYILGLDDFQSNLQFEPVEPYSIISALVQQQVVDFRDFDEELPEGSTAIRFGSKDQQAYSVGFSESYIHLARDISPYEAIAYYKKEKKSQRRPDCQKIAFSPKHTQAKEYELHRRGTSVVPYNVWLPPPKPSSPLFVLYMLALYTPFAVSNLRSSYAGELHKTWSLAELRTEYEQELARNRQLQVFAANILNFHDTLEHSIATAREYDAAFNDLDQIAVRTGALEERFEPIDHLQHAPEVTDAELDMLARAAEEDTATDWEGLPLANFLEHVKAQASSTRSSAALSSAPYERLTCELSATTNTTTAAKRAKNKVNKKIRELNVPVSAQTWITTAKESEDVANYVASTVSRKLIDPLEAVKLSHDILSRRGQIMGQVNLVGPLPPCTQEALDAIGHPSTWGNDLPLLDGCVPTALDTIKLFTLKEAPAIFAFMLFAEWVDGMVQHLLCPQLQAAPTQLQMLIQGAAGAGKTWICKAMLWYLRQHGLLTAAFGCAFQGLAAVNMSNNHFSAGTIHSVFDIHPHKGPQGDTASLNSRFRGKILAFMDEVYSVDIYLMAHCHQQLARAKQCSDATIMYGGISIVQFGDVNQLTLSTPIYRNLSNQASFAPHHNEGRNDDLRREATQKERLGNTVHKSTQNIILLGEVQRQLDTEGGHELKAMVEELTRGNIPVDLIEKLNERTLDKVSGDWSNAVFLSTRHKVLDKMAFSLAKASALAQGKQLVVFDAIDRHSNGGELSAFEQNALSNKHYKQTKGDAKCASGSHKKMCFFEGAIYKFTGSFARHLDFITNGECEAVKLLLHPNEPEIDPDKQIVRLMYLPIAIIVRPVRQTRTFDLGFGPNNIPIFAYNSTFEILGEDKTEVQITRTGFPHLRMPQIFTDYAVQGQTIREPKKGLVDLRLPKNKKMGRATWLVMLSRFVTFLQIALAAPLWTTDAEKLAYCTELAKIVKPCNDLLAEKGRQEHFAQVTKTKNQERWALSQTLASQASATAADALATPSRSPQATAVLKTPAQIVHRKRIPQPISATRTKVTRTTGSSASHEIDLVHSATTRSPVHGKRDGEEKEKESNGNRDMLRTDDLDSHLQLLAARTISPTARTNSDFTVLETSRFYVPNSLECPHSRSAAAKQKMTRQADNLIGKFATRPTSDILIPFHHSPFNHYSLFRINCSTKTICHYNSLRSCTTTHFNEVKETLCKSTEKFTGTRYTFEEVLVPQQNNGIDCGIFTILFADAILSNKPLRLVTQSRVTRYRKRFFSND